MKIAAVARHEMGGAEMGRALGDDLLAEFAGERVDLCMLFATAHFEDEIERIVASIHERVRPGAFVGTTGETVIWDSHEYEGRPAMALWGARLPGVDVASFHLSQDDLERLEEPAAWHDYLGVSADREPHFVLLGDPFSFNILEALERLGAAYPGRPAIGGLASAGDEPGQNVVMFEGQPLRQGMCGVALSGNIVVETVVSQGCRPIGHHMVITGAERNVIREIGGRPPLAVVIETLRECSARDVELARTGGLLVGRVINEQQQNFASGDFLIRNPIGFEQETGALALNDLVRTGQTIQFHVRDGASADDDLTALLAAQPRGPVAGALLFTCNGRGTQLFPERDHDARAVARRSRPVAGLFCAGEIGPIGPRNYVHAHTASVGFFRSKVAASED